MFLLLPRLLLALGVFVTIVTAAPASKPGVSSAKWKSKKVQSLVLVDLTPDEAACAPDQPTAFAYTCYTTLDMDSYYRDWWMNNRQQCSGLGFAQCFLKYNHYAGLTCDQITSDTCSPPDSNGNWDSIQQFYGVWNIYTVHQFFTQYYNAFGLANTLALGRITDMVNQLRPKQAQVDGKIAAILIAFSLGELTMGKELIASPNPAIAVAMKMRFVGISALVGGLSQLANYFWGTSHAPQNQGLLDIGNLENELSTMTLTYMNQLAAMLVEVERDPVQFLKLVQFGGFSERIDTSLPSEVSQILNQLTIYILGSILKSQNAIIAINLNKSPLSEAHASPRVVCPSLDQFNTCGQWWYDADTHTTYTLENTQNPGDQNYGDLTHTIWKNGWTTPKDFYAMDDPNTCNGRDPSLDENGMINCANPLFKCVATNQNIDVNSPDPNTMPEFTNCANSRQWLVNGCSRYECSICVPCSYMGPILAADGGHMYINPGCGPGDTCL